MGTKCTPTYPNIFMGIFEEAHIYPLIKKKCNYISDIQITYFSYGQVLKTNYNNLYQNSIRYTPPLSLISTTKKTKIHFLVITTGKRSTGKLLTTLYKKEIDWQSYLHGKLE